MHSHDYQNKASRTINKSLEEKDLTLHALHGMVGEIGEIHSLYQKVYQGHPMDKEHLIKEVGDLLWFISEFCTANGVMLGDVMERNIEKLKARYKEGFSVEESLNRAEGDV